MNAGASNEATAASEATDPADRPLGQRWVSHLEDEIVRLRGEVERLRAAEAILREGLEHVRDEHTAAQATVDEMQCHWCDTHRVLRRRVWVGNNCWV